MPAADTLSARFDALYRSHQHRVQRLCLGYCGGDADTANDLQQEVFLRVWLNLGQFRGQAALSTWLYRICVNTCLQWVRQRRRHPETTGQPLPPDLPAPPAVADDPLAARLAQLHRALARLPEADRLLLMLVLDEQPYAQVAEIVGQTEGHVRVRLHRIRQRLARLLQQLPDEDDAF